MLNAYVITGNEDKPKIIHHRCAEVLVPDFLDLSPLRYVWCRSPAEYQTLFHILKPQTRLRYQGKFGVGAKADVHFRRWTFIEEVSLESNRITFRFNPSTLTPGPFHAKVEITSHKHGKLSWTEPQFRSSPTFVLTIPQITSPVDYEVQFTLDDQLSYSSHFKAADSGLIGTRKS